MSRDACDELGEKIEGLPPGPERVDALAELLRLYTVKTIFSIVASMLASEEKAVARERAACVRVAAKYDYRAADAIRARGSK